MATESGSCTRKFRWGWKRGTKQVKPVPPRKLPSEPKLLIIKKSR
jgi:hypothetical protein